MSRRREYAGLVSTAARAAASSAVASPRIVPITHSMNCCSAERFPDSTDAAVQPPEGVLRNEPVRRYARCIATRIQHRTREFNLKKHRSVSRIEPRLRTCLVPARPRVGIEMPQSLLERSCDSALAEQRLQAGAAPPVIKLIEVSTCVAGDRLGQ